MTELTPVTESARVCDIVAPLPGSATPCQSSRCSAPTPLPDIYGRMAARAGVDGARGIGGQWLELIVQFKLYHYHAFE